MKVRIILLTLLLTMTAAGAQAQNTIAILHKEAQVAKFAFTEKPVVTYAGNELVMTTTKTSVQYLIYLLQKIDFDVEELPDDVQDVKTAPTGDVRFSFRDGALVVTGSEPETTVTLYRVDGAVVKQFRTDRNGSATIPTARLNRDVYIVRTQHVSFKFRKP